ncbi:hypothetical protein [Methylobacterium soli]|uniref:Uncharacterized protein n=1 Tax=Methylobacterium soli TaxID=553447 RepID=A0A6L3T7B1_9HYPH|nr:hypothetical protein [Methylobacterium soli]KAB1079398.1 hypothetical protein F6X53_11385 [Methylobacterium soli]GJE42074.1 hypothetical protein AEGHOMDF_1245 [Methylobacterium soli]
MSQIRVFHDADRGAIFVSMVNAAFPSRTLVASRVGDLITLQIFNADQTLVAALWTDYARRDGSGFEGPDEAFAYVSDECNRAPARMPTVTAAAGEDIAAGMPVALSRADSTLRIARADTYPLAFVVGLAAVDVGTGFAGRGVRTYVTLPDWTEVAGTPSLAVGQTYFLAPEGGIAVMPPILPGQCSVRVGNAIAAQTLAFIQADPILL